MTHPLPQTPQSERWLVNTWVPILSGPDRVESLEATELDADALKHSLTQLDRTSALAITFEGSSLHKRHEFEKIAKSADLRVERHVAFPGTGGGFVLLPLMSASAFCSGTRLLPSGRARWRTVRKILQLGGKFGLASRLRRPELWTIQRQQETESDEERGGVAIQSGVPGPDRCVIAQITARDGETVGFTKMACSIQGGRRLIHEAEILHEVLGLSLKHARIPHLFGSDEQGRWLAFSPVAGDRSGDQLGPVHHRFLDELHESTRTETVLEDLQSFREACTRIEALQRDARDERLARIVELRDLMKSTYSGLEIGASLAHGDFTPWNLLVQPGKPLGVIDWEDARRQAAHFHDELHFTLRVGVLVQRAKTKELHKQLLKLSERRTGARARITHGSPWLSLYLIDAASAHMEQCRIARPPFAQVAWLEDAHDELIQLELQRLRASGSNQGPRDGRSFAA